jgi:subtilisin family serine protease
MSFPIVGRLLHWNRAESTMKIRKNRSIQALWAVTLSLMLPLAASADDRLQRALARDGEVRVMVRMALPEGSSMASGVSRNENRRDRIARAAQRLAAPLGRRGSVRVVRRFSEVPWLALAVNASGLAALQSSPDVAFVGLDRLERVSLIESSPLIGASEVNSEGLRGAGWGIVIIDTGVESDHPFLGGRVIREACFSVGGSCADGSTEMIGPGAGEPCDFSSIACGHGTHVAGVAAGSGRTGFGVAPEADLIAIQTFTEFTGEDCEDAGEDPCALAYLSDITKGLEYAYSLRDEIPIAAVNLSLGGELFSSVSDCEASDPRTEIVGLLREARIAVVAAAGNESSVDSLTTPACLTDVLSVSATTDQDEISIFSNTAPFLDFFAPGDRIISSFPGGGYSSLSGSSQATPQVSGAYALLFEALGRAELELATEALRSSGRQITDELSGEEFPRVQIDSAIGLLALDRRATGLQITPDGRRTLLSKDLANERWAIVLNADDGSVSGNVFLADGAEPAFVSCSGMGDDGGPEPATRQFRFACEGAPKCVGSCAAEDWTSLGSVELPGSFFMPRPRYPFPAPTTESGAAASDSSAGIREIRDRGRVLVSKDAGGKRWAIAWNEDGTVTGNVYDPGGGAPQFVWCADLGDDGNNSLADRVYRFRCEGADPCFEGTCGPDTWTDLGEVSLPGSFFQP